MRKSTKQKSRIRKSKMRERKLEKSRRCKYNFENRLISKFHDLISAIINENEDYINNLTTKHLIINGDYLCYGTPLHRAAEIGNYEIFQKLIKVGADINKRLPETQKTILHSAMTSSNYDIVKYLIENGVDVNVALENSGLETGKTALHLAAETGTEEVITLLLSNNADINAKADNGITPIISAVRAENYDAMKALIEYEPDLFCTYEEDGETKTIFHLAIETENYIVLARWLLLLYDKRDANSNNNNNLFSFFKSQLLLHYALSHRSIDVGIFFFLLESGVDVNAVDSNNKLAIELEYIPENNLLFEAIEQHIVKLIAAGFYVCDRNITAVSNLGGFDDYLAECRLEVEEMKKNKLEDSNITFIEVLHKNVRYLAPYLKFIDLKNILKRESPFSEYLIYNSDIFMKLGKTMKRVYYIKDSEEVMYDIFYELQLPATFIRELYFYLSNDDLQNMIPLSTRKNYGLL